ncbi:hypothetical protein CPT_Scapp_026 [Serratia phage Scapp]|uniref:Uncharacterized protein n=1 Tax=Serratia phage Scapp TaxID=2282409 RepID=A0A345L6Q3_9CAUD|nr:tail terminator [Serratia phage Scapp]AXH50955.1 hypothetical protein CPT_Scapp_026 [Serratia phage Scapp]
MSQAIIDRILEREFVTIKAANPAAYPNTPFNPPDNAPFYLEYHIIPAGPQVLDLASAAVIYRGSWQINVVGVRDVGVELLRREADRIAGLLLADHEMRDPISGVSVYLNGACGVFSGITDDDAYIIPLSVDYRADILLNV